jgi:Ca-activated chloride channel family protein
MLLTAGRKVALAAALAAAPLAAQPPATPTNTLRVPAGQHLLLELQDDLHTRYSQTGDPARFSITQDVLVGSVLALPEGTKVVATLIEVRKPGRAGRPGRIAFRFDQIELPDGTVRLLEATLLRAGFFDATKGRLKSGEDGGRARKAATVGIDAAGGALLGASIGGGKGAAYGGAVGTGIGLIQILLEKGPHLDLPQGTMFEVELERELTVSAATVQLARRLPPPLADPAGDAAADADSPESKADDVPDFSSAQAETVESAPAAAETATMSSTDIPSGPLPPGPDDPYRLKVDVNLVLVDAVVRGAGGRPMGALQREDFRVFEDGVEQKVTHFSRDELPLAVALVIDRSGSVMPYLSEIRQAAYQTLQQLKPGDQVALFAFDSDVDRLENLTPDRQRIAQRIARIRAGGGTNITGALYEATLYLRSAAPERRRALILISDNQATVRGVPQDRVIQTALEADTVIYSIRTPGESGPFFMRTLAMGAGSVRKMTEETGGEILDVESVGSLRAAMAAVISRLKTRYTLGYHSSNKARDGAFRRIEVRLADRFGQAGTAYSVYARKGYYAPAAEVAAQSAPR